MSVTPDQAEALDAYEALVRLWAPRLDLVAPGDVDRFRSRHIDDSLRIAPLIRAAPSGPAVDVGSGAGLPGIPLAVCEPGRTWHLLEPRAKRAGFLEEVVRALELRNCEVVATTAESAAADRRFGGVHVVGVARALAAPVRAFDLLLPLIRPGGIAAVFVGPTAERPPESREWAPGIATMTRRGAE